jgi:hypothetical protein
MSTEPKSPRRPRRRRVARRTALLPAVALLALPSSAASLGLPTAYLRSIVITGSGQGVQVMRFEVSARSVASKVRVTVRVGAKSTAGTRGLVVAVGPCTAGPATSPLCKPTASARLVLSKTPIDTTRSFLVARPARFPDALRVTLTRADQPVPFARERVGGGGGTAEMLLNGATWRFRSSSTARRVSPRSRGGSHRARSPSPPTSERSDCSPCAYRSPPGAGPSRAPAQPR